jgi:ATP-dependent helicase HepA
VVIDESGQDHAERLDLEAALQQSQRVDKDTAIKVVKARQSELTQMLESAELVADTRVTGLIADARTSGRDLLGHEVARLVALQKVNPGVRNDEIEFFQGQLDHFENALEHARLRLDAVRVIVAI